MRNPGSGTETMRGDGGTVFARSTDTIITVHEVGLITNGEGDGG